MKCPEGSAARKGGPLCRNRLRLREIAASLKIKVVNSENLAHDSAG